MIARLDSIGISRAVTSSDTAGNMEVTDYLLPARRYNCVFTNEERRIIVVFLLCFFVSSLLLLVGLFLWWIGCCRFIL